MKYDHGGEEYGGIEYERVEYEMTDDNGVSHEYSGEWRETLGNDVFEMEPTANEFDKNFWESGPFIMKVVDATIREVGNTAMNYWRLYEKYISPYFKKESDKPNPDETKEDENDDEDYGA